MKGCDYYKLSESGTMLCEADTNETIFQTGSGKDFCIERNCAEEELRAYFSGILRDA